MLTLLLACQQPIKEPADSTPDTSSPADPTPDPDCTSPGCLRRVTSYGSWTRAEIEPWLSPGVTIENGYEVLEVEYVTVGTTATATVTLPIDLDRPAPTEGFPIVVNAHGTIGLDDPCKLSGTLSGTGLAALFGGRGAIGVAPDYPGLGGPGYHPYLDAEAEAKSILDATRATLQLASWRAVDSSARVAVVGLSQGGHAVIATAMWHSRYAPELDIRAFGASGPASVYEEQWSPGLDYRGEHQVMFAMLAWSFAEVAGISREGIWAESIADSVDSHLLSRCMWSPDFTDEPVLTDDFPVAAEGIFSPEFLTEFRSGDWNQWAAVGEGFARNRIRPWLELGEQTAPLAIWQGTADTTVTAAMTTAMVNDLRTGGIEVEYYLVEGGEHVNTAFGFLAYPELATEESVAWIKGHLEEHSATQ